MVKIYIDPGHGGMDPGAVANGLREKDLTLKISLKIRNLLNQYKGGVSVRLSRTTDKTLSLRQRTNDANKWCADYLLSVHINAGSGTGYEDFIYSELSSNSDTAKKRDFMHEEINKQINMPNRGKKKANFHMVRESNMPAILTENGFIDAANDAARLKTDAFLNDIAQGHVDGLVRIFNLRKKESTPMSTSSTSDSVLIETGGLSVDMASEVLGYCISKNWSCTIHYDGDNNPRATVGKLNTKWRREFENWLKDQGWYYKLI
ncbi:N-acetylmuramoyl-L-alanine amidase [Gracilibacillus sp. JCM 18860]|uniref:N-acetylmuramoyl-L-alanine amidase n=1 Tax=Gracilibacillus sp. JCM 18860 TaxID=1306159 RepID=UPI0006D2808C